MIELARISGLEIAITADTSGVTAGLHDITTESVKVSKNLKTVESLLKLDPTNTTLLAERQRLLAGAIGTTREKLNRLQAAQEDVTRAFERGDISEEQYLAFQSELVRTESRLRDLESQAEDTTDGMNELGEGSDDASDSMNDANEKAGKLGETLKNGLKIGATVAAAAVAAVAAAAFKLAKDVVEKFGELEQNLGGSEAVFGEYAARIQKTGEDAYKNLGVSQSEYLANANKMGALLQGSGFDVEQSLTMTEKSMQRAADMASVMGIDTKDALEAVAGAAKGNFTMMDNLGVAINDTTLQLYAQEKGLGKLETTQDKVSAAMQLFLEKTEQYDGNFAREATETISGSFGLLGASWESLIAGLGNGEADIEKLTANVADALNSVIKNITPVIQNIIKALPSVFKVLIDAVKSLIPQILPVVIDLFNQVLNALIDLIPTLIPFAVDALMMIVNTLIDNAPLLIESAMMLIVQLQNGLADAMPTLIPKIVEIVLLIMDTLVNNADLLLDSSVNLVMAVAEGIIRSLPIIATKGWEIVKKLYSTIVERATETIEAGAELVSKISDGIKSWFSKITENGREIVGKLGDGIKSMASQAVTWGKDMIQGIIDGIKSKIGAVKDAVGNVAETIKSYLHFSVPDVGPLTDYETWMPDFMKGLASGIEKNKYLVTNAVRDLAGGMTVNPQLVASSSGAGTASGGMITQTIIINLNASINNDMDVRKVAEDMGREIQTITISNDALKGVTG